MYKDLTTIQTYKTDVEAIKQSIKNILLTRRGSVPGKPRFGSDLYKIIFSQMDTLTESIAKNYVYEALSEYEDRIVVKELSIKSIYEYNKIVIDIKFEYKDADFTTDMSSVAVSINL